MEKNYRLISLITFIVNIIIFGIFINRNQYIYDVSLFKCVLFTITNVIFIFCTGIAINQESTYKANIKKYIIFYFIPLICVTLIIGRPFGGIFSWVYHGQLIPFHTIISQIKYGSLRSITINILGNCLLFIPLSFILMIKDKKYNNILRQTLIIVPIIIAIELLQAITHAGAFDIDDIILNYLGIIIFTFLITRFNLIEKIRNLFYTDFKLNAKVKHLIYSISLLLVIIYDICLYIVK